jgi:hypothetical protein
MLMKVFVASLVLLSCLTGATFLCPAQATDVLAAPMSGEAQVVLVAPSECRVGELVRLDVSESTADSFKWALVPDSEDFLVYDGGKRAVFSARVEGDHRFIVACAKDGTVDVMTFTIRVLGPPPMPMSDSLAEWIPFWNWSAGLPREEAEMLAASFEAIAARVDELEEPVQWIKATAEANRKVLGDRIDAWGPMLDKIGAALLERAEIGALTTPEEHAAVWLEVAQGLRSI